MTLMSKLSLFGIKLETTPGTKETLSGTHASYNVYDFEIEPDIQMDERDSLIGFGTQRSVPGARMAKATFKFDLTFDGDALPGYTATIFPSCGLYVTSDVFKPKSQPPDAASAVVKTATIGKWTNGKYECIYGAMGNLKLVGVTNKKAVFECEYTGIYGGESAVALPSFTPPDDDELMCKNGVCTFDSVAQCVESWTLDLGNDVVGKVCFNKEQGYDYFFVQNRKPKLTINPESVLIATQDVSGIYVAGTEAEQRIVIPAPGYNAGTGAGSIEILAPQAQIMSKKPGDREGVRINDMTLQLNTELGVLDSDFSITYNMAS